ncbi:MAG TPA: hypothetical protein VEC59_14460 [Steroidobacteraceae bacterium]|nr:hypothetical protein [Steroidobacteraceae bacterium]
MSLVRSGPIKDRLAEAYRNHLAYVRAEDLPQALREDFRACHDALTRERPLRGEDAVRATVRKMSGIEADELACTVVRLFAAIVRECATDEAHALAARSNGVVLNGAALNGAPLNGFNAHAAGGRAKNGAAQVIAV